MSPKFKIGDRVKNINSYWNSAVCYENNNYTQIGIQGVVTNIGRSNGNYYGYAYEVKWDNGLYCGKSEASLELVQKAMTTVEKKVYDYAVSVKWDEDKLAHWICNSIQLLEYDELIGTFSKDKAQNFINKFKLKTESMNHNVSEDKQELTTFKVSRQALAEVFPLVCSDYKDKIKQAVQIDLFSNEVEVPEFIVRLAHKDATKTEHKEWLDKYLPLPKKKKIELVKYLKSDGESAIKWSIGVDPNYKIELVLPKEVSSLKYDVMKVNLQGDEWDIFLGHFNDGITED